MHVCVCMCVCVCVCVCVCYIFRFTRICGLLPVCKAGGGGVGVVPTYGSRATTVATAPTFTPTFAAAPRFVGAAVAAGAVEVTRPLLLYGIRAGFSFLLLVIVHCTQIDILIIFFMQHCCEQLTSPE